MSIEEREKEKKKKKVSERAAWTKRKRTAKVSVNNGQ